MVSAERNRAKVLEWQRRHPEKVREKQRRYDAKHRRPRPTQEERFWAKVEKGDGCWVWTASCLSGGYGQFRFDGTMRRAHRVAFFFTHGRWPVAALHACDNPPCVRIDPRHVFEGTQTDNMRDAAAKGRIRNQHSS